MLKGKAKLTTAIDHVSEGADQYLRMLRDGSLVQMPWLTAKVLEGKVYGVQAGILTTPITCNATIADGEPDVLVTVPSGTTIIPVYISVAFEDTGTAQVMDVLAVASSVYDNAVTATAATIYNLRTDKPTGGSQCTAYSVVTAAGTACESGNFFEFWRPYAGFAEDGFNSSTSWGNNALHGAKWQIGESLVPPAIVGAGSLNIFASAQAGTAFITAIWVEEITSNVT